MLSIWLKLTDMSNTSMIIGNTNSIRCIEGFNAIAIITLNISKIIYMKSFGKMVPTKLFMINSAFVDLMIGLLIVVVAYTDYLIEVTGHNKVLLVVNRVGKCGLFSFTSVFLTHKNAYELFRVQVISRPFLRQRVTNKFVIRFIGTVWCTTLSLTIASHTCMEFLLSRVSLEYYERIMISSLATITIPTHFLCFGIIYSALNSRQRNIIQINEEKIISGRNRLFIDFTRLRRSIAIASLFVSCICWMPLITWTIIQFTQILIDYRTMVISQLLTYLLAHINITWNTMEDISFLISERREEHDLSVNGRVRVYSFLTDQVSTAL